jgi:hypothetical protein
MFIATKRLYGASIQGPDGDVGTVKDLLFDDQSWKVRYLDVDTGRWLPDRRVILSPTVVHSADYADRRLAVGLTRHQVEQGPSLDADMPVSRQKEIDLASYYAWGAYWASLQGARESAETEGDPNLRSARAVSEYHILANNGEIGHVEDLILDDEAGANGPWEIRYLVVDTRNWLPGRHVLISPAWAESIDWATQRVEVGLSREMVESSPMYDPNAPVNREYEEVLYDYYGRPKYWTGTAHPV